MDNLKTTIHALRERWFAIRYPQSYKDHGCPKKPYKDTNANELTKSIIDWIKYDGWDARRQNTMGVYRNGRYTYGGGRKGTADIQAIIAGRAVSIDVKFGKDRMSVDQMAEKLRVEQAGGVYFIAQTMQQFADWYQEKFGDTPNRQEVPQ